MNIGSLIATIGADIKPLKKAMSDAKGTFQLMQEDFAASQSKMNAKMQEVGKSMSSIGGKMSLGLTLPIAAFGAASYKMSMDWAESMAKINTTAQLPQAELTKLSDTIKRLGSDVGADLSLIPEAYEKIISATGDVALSTDILEQALKGAKAGFTDIDVVSGALAQSLSAIGAGGATAEQVLDTLFAAKRVGAGEFADFAKYIPSLIASGKALGVNYQEVSGAFAYMTAKGNDAAQSAMLIQNTFSALGKVDIQAGLKASGVAVFDTEGKMRGLADIMSEVGQVMSSMNDEEKTAWLDSIELKDMQAKQAFMVLSSETDRLREIMDDTANSTGEAGKALDFAKNPAQTFTEAMNRMKAITISFGDIVLPIFNAVIAAVSKMLNWINSLSTETKTIVVVFAAVVAAIGPLLFGVGKLLMILPNVITAIHGVKSAFIATKIAVKELGVSVKKLGAFMAANPFTIWIVAIGAAIAALTILWKKSAGFRAVVKYVAESISVFFQRAWVQIKQGAEMMWLGIKTYFTAIPKLAAAVFNVIKRVMKGESIGDAFKDEFSKVIPDVTDEAKGIKEKYNKELAAIEGPRSFKEILDQERAVEEAAETGEKVGEAFSGGVVTGATETVTGATETVTGATETVTGTRGMVSEAIGKAEFKAPELIKTRDIDKDIDRQEDQLKQMMEELDNSMTFSTPTIGSAQLLEMSLLNVTAEMDKAKNSARLLGEEFDPVAARQEILGKEIDRLTQENLPANKQAIETLAAEYRNLKTDMEATAANTIDVGTMIESTTESMFETIGEGLGDMFTGAASAGDMFSNLLGLVADFMAQLGKSLIATAVAAKAFKIVANNPALAIGAGIALIALSKIVKAKFAAGITGGGGGGESQAVPQMANGGLVYGSTLLQAGEYPGARTDPEAIVRVSKLQDMIKGSLLDLTGSASAQIPATVNLVVSGENLEAVLNLRQKRMNNMR